MRQVRRHMQYIFQDPYSSLNPVLTVGDIVAEPLRIHGLYDSLGGATWVAQLFEMVGLSTTMMQRYPRSSLAVSASALALPGHWRSSRGC